MQLWIVWDRYYLTVIRPPDGLRADYWFALGDPACLATWPTERGWLWSYSGAGECLGGINDPHCLILSSLPLPKSKISTDYLKLNAS